MHRSVCIYIHGERDRSIDLSIYLSIYVYVSISIFFSPPIPTTSNPREAKQLKTRPFNLKPARGKKYFDEPLGSCCPQAVCPPSGRLTGGRLPCPALPSPGAHGRAPPEPADLMNGGRLQRRKAASAQHPDAQNHRFPFAHRRPWRARMLKDLPEPERKS